jgi:hypothetical protein
MDLLTTCTLTTRDYTLQIANAHRLASSVCYGLHLPFPGNRINTVEILQLSALMFSYHSPRAEFLSTDNSTNSDDPTCERCLQEDDSVTHILCDCEAIGYLRFCHLGQFFMEPSDFYDAP